MKADYVDELIVKDLLTKFGDLALRNEAIQRVVAGPTKEASEQEREKDRLATEITKLDKRLNDLRLKACVGDVSLEEWRSLREVLEERRQELSERLSAVPSRDCTEAWRFCPET